MVVKSLDSLEFRPITPHVTHDCSKQCKGCPWPLDLDPVAHAEVELHAPVATAGELHSADLCQEPGKQELKKQCDLLLDASECVWQQQRRSGEGEKLRG